MYSKQISTSSIIISLCIAFIITGKAFSQSSQTHEAEAIAKAIKESNESFDKRMAKWQRTAKRIRIDGQARDWLKLPRFKDPQGDIKDPSLDVIELGLVCHEKHLDVIVITKSKPSKRNFGVNITLDVSGNHNPDIMVSVKNDQLIARFYNNNQNNYNLDTKSTKILKKSSIRFGRVIELRLVLDEVAPSIKKIQMLDIPSPEHKPIFRAQVKCWDGKAYSEISPKIAAYRFSKKAYEYYGKLPKSVQTEYAIHMPLKGRWFLGQGAHSTLTHTDRWAYDFWILGPDGTSTRSKPIKSLNQFYCYGKELYAPLEGKVVHIVDGEPDQTPRVYNPKAKSNAVMIRSDAGLDVMLSHLLKGTVTPQKGELVKHDAFLGKIGNSGRSYGPHLDLMAFAGKGKQRKTVPLALKNVRISINNMEDDPWARDEKYWPIREGYYITSLDK